MIIVEDGLPTPRISLPYRKAERAEAVRGALRLATNDEPTVLVLRGAYGLVARIDSYLREYGVSPFMIEVVDPLILESLHDRAGMYLEELHYQLVRGRPYESPTRLDPSKRTSRKALFRRLLSAIAIPVNGPILLDPESCERARYCSLCVESCPTSALVGKPPRLRVEACIECSFCFKSCPLGLLSLPGHPPDRLISLVKAARPVQVIIAERSEAGLLHGYSPEVPTIVELVPCLDMISERLLLSIIKEGVIPIVVTRQHSPNILRLERVGLLSVALEPPETPPSIKQRALQDPSAWPSQGIIELVEGRCTFCGVCSEVCPTGAIIFENRGVETVLTVYEERCVGCTLCERYCPQGALRVKTVVESKTHRRLEIKQPHARCIKCGRPLNAPIAFYSEISRRTGIKIEELLLCGECRITRLYEEVLGKS